MTRTNFFVDVSKNTLLGPRGECRLQHHQAAVFLRQLIEQGPAGGGAFPNEIWRESSPHAREFAPDRTAMRRVVRAARDGLIAVGSLSEISSEPRRETVGPWSFQRAHSEEWSVKRPLRVSSRAPIVEADIRACSLTVDLSPNQLEPALSHLLIAEDLAAQSHFLDAARHLSETEPSLLLSPGGAALFKLRAVKWLRRAGQYGDSKQSLVDAQTLAHAAHPVARKSLLAELGMESARIQYEMQPSEVRRKSQFTRLSDQIEAAGAPALRWQLENLRALQSRRKLQRLLLTSTRTRETELAATEKVANAHFHAAFYWLAFTADSYHLQAVLVNYAYHMQWQAEQTSASLTAPQMNQVISIWRLSQSMVEKFDLPDDSAWDYIMLADLWLGQKEARPILRSDWRLWPKQRTPAKLDFYHRCIELAMTRGDVRQKVLALDRCAAFHMEMGDARQSAERLNQRDALTYNNEALVKQLSGDRLWMPAPSSKR